MHERRRFRGYACALALAVTIVGSFGASASGVGISSAIVRVPQPPFHGIFQFSGRPQIDNPYLAGGVLVFSWAQLEANRGAFDWSRVDRGINRWASVNKQVAIRVEASGPSAQATPQWLFDEGVPAVVSGGTKFPVYWNPTYLSELQTFITAFTARYNGNPHIAWVEGAVGIYGETKPDRRSAAPLWQPVGYTDARWMATLQTIVGMWVRGLPLTHVSVAVEKGFFDSTGSYTVGTTVDWLRTQGIWPENHGVRLTTSYADPNWNTGASIDEQNVSAATSGDTLLQDLQKIIALRGTYAVIYGSDIEQPANQPALAWAASLVR